LRLGIYDVVISSKKIDSGERVVREGSKTPEPKGGVYIKIK